MSPRPILVFHRSCSSFDVGFALARAGWDPFVIREIESLKACDIAGYRLGLAVFEEQDDVRAQELHDLANIGLIEWVVAVPRSVLQDAEAARALVDEFEDFHTLPIQMDRLLVVLGHVSGKIELGDRLSAPKPQDASAPRYGMVGCSPAMDELCRNIEKMVRVDAPVLISGESGTGKEVAARAIHEHSQRRAGPFVPVNCGALPTGLIQSELFGHEKGAFTGAHQRKAGSIESAAGGTIFLDEIGDLPLESQASLLRFLQERQIARVGSSRPFSVEARVIAATNIDLVNATRCGRFREDLFYRLNVLHLDMPALRERDGDVRLLADFAFQQFSMQKAPRLQGFSHEARAAMESYHWPGNVRELINRVQKAMVMCEGTHITAEDLGLRQRDAAKSGSSLDRARDTLERDLICSTLARTQHNVASAARQLGVSRVTLYRMMERLEIRRTGNGG